MMSSIVVLGSVNLDIVATVARLPRAGETITGAALSRYPGGKGANQALAARRLGADVSLVAQVGNDAEANIALSLLREGGVDLSGVETSTVHPTGTALIAVAASGENQIIVAPGANAALRGVQLPAADALICQLEVPAESVVHAVAQFEGFVCVNLAPSKEIDDAVLRQSDLVIVNETEAEWYGDKLDVCTGWVARSLGASGAELWKAGELVVRCDAPRVTAVDTTAAGDTFVAALTVALIENQAPRQALEFACAAGAAAVRSAGAQPSLPSRDEVEDLL